MIICIMVGLALGLLICTSVDKSEFSKVDIFMILAALSATAIIAVLFS